LHYQELRNHRHLRWNHHRAEQRSKADAAAGPLQTGESISGKRAAEECAD
jgi:hypothetical protein